MTDRGIHKKGQRFAFDLLVNIGICVGSLFVSAWLLSGSNLTGAYIKNDLLTEPARIIFVVVWPLAYLSSWLFLRFHLRILSFDWVNRVVITNMACFLIIGSVLSVARVPLLSRTIFLTEFILSSVTLLLFFFVRSHLFPIILAVDRDVSVGQLPRSHGVRYLKLEELDHLPEGILGIVIDSTKKEITQHAMQFAEWAQKGLLIWEKRDLFQLIAGRMVLEEVTLSELEQIGPPRIYTEIRRICDLISAILLLPIFIVLFLMAGLAIKLETRGPILFRQNRVGLNGNLFTMLKFRSMYNARHQAKGAFAEKMDTRITKVGSFLRRFRLDEFPQLLNIIKGDMSLIGPRPEQPNIVAEYSLSIPYYGYRHIVRPGVTGWAQVSYGYAASEAESKRKLEYDFFYIKNMSVWLDLIIVFRTILTVLHGSGVR
mgnify:CR=1 FL=1